MKQIHRREEAFPCKLRHLDRRLTALLNRKSRRVEETLVEKAERVFFLVLDRSFLLLFRDREACKLYKATAERKKHDRCRYIKAAVDHGNSHSACRCAQEGKMNDRVDRIKDDHKNNGTDNIKVKMDQRRALCVL